MDGSFLSNEQTVSLLISHFLSLSFSLYVCVNCEFVHSPLPSLSLSVQLRLGKGHGLIKSPTEGDIT